jgi:hypothetical protein
MQRFPAASFVAALVTALFLSLLVGCSGTSSTPNAVVKIVLTPTALSMNQGQVGVLSAVAQNAAGGVVAADINFASSNTGLAQISSGGLICAGAWDSNFVTCTPHLGTAGVGQVTITATAATNSTITATMTLYVHEQVDRVIATAPGNCTSMGQTATMSAVVLSTSAPGCSVANPCDITSTVGPITFGSSDPSIASVSSTGTLTAVKPGGTSVFASVSGVNSVAQPYETCPVSFILVHNATDYTSNFTIAAAGTQALKADVYDIKGTNISPTLTWGSNFPASATVVGGTGTASTVTGVTPGATMITATCSTPDCNANLPAQYALNPVTVTVSGSGDTTVYAASTSSTSLVPISTANNTAQTAITLPSVPNSILADPSGKKVYLGSATNLMQVDKTTGAVTTVAVPGNVVAISSGGTYVVVSDGTGNNVYVVNSSTGATVFKHPVTTLSAAFTPDSKTTWFFNQTLAFADTVTSTPVQFTLPYVASAVAFNGTGSLAYLTSNTAHQIDVRSSCDRSELQTLASNNPTLVAAIPTGNGVVVADSPNLDVITSTVTPNMAAGCPVSATNSIVSFNLGVGAFAPMQMFLSPDSSHVWIISNLAELVSFNLTTSTPVAIPFANSATPLSGGVRLDGQQLYIGASDGTVHRIDVASNSDAAQITVGLKDSSGKAVNPNLVAVLP